MRSDENGLLLPWTWLKSSVNPMFNFNSTEDFMRCDEDGLLLQWTYMSSLQGYLKAVEVGRSLWARNALPGQHNKNKPGSWPPSGCAENILYTKALSYIFPGFY